MRRLAFQFFILVSMAVVAYFNEDVYVALVSLLCLIAVPINWSVAGVLLWSSAQAPDIRSLADRADDAVTLAVNSTVAAVVVALILGRMLGFIPVAVSLAITVGLGFIIVSNSLPNIRFAQTWRDVYVPILRSRNISVGRASAEPSPPTPSALEGDPSRHSGDWPPSDETR